MLYFLEQLSLTKKIIVGDTPINYSYSSRSEYFSRMIETNKEPDTIGWIDQLRGISHFIDVGACVGTYGIYFAKKNKASELVFVEPFWLNYVSLLQNLKVNDVVERAIAFHAAVASKRSSVFIKPSSDVPGSSMHENVTEKTAFDGRESVYKVASVRFDDIFKQLERVEKVAVKIDVDGPECDIVSNLASSELINFVDNICIEVTANSKEFICENLMKCGFEIYEPLEVYRNNADAFNIYFRRIIK